MKTYFICQKRKLKWTSALKRFMKIKINQSRTSEEKSTLRRVIFGVLGATKKTKQRANFGSKISEQGMLI